MYSSQRSLYCCIGTIDHPSSTIQLSSSSSNTGLVAGSVTMSVIIVTLIVILIVETIVIVYMKKLAIINTDNEYHLVLDIMS